ncbi:transmembrane and ubiquitin-like domain-containing protein 1 [Homalodisca vitripennis]|uniref:transmembrane and ubiquitin-like domain-containing protein 1 n=1 Tax=Homalodisca vitripennis TaxID=197043 RepID=UPI001EEADE86|nr:transmembrane and ubiquitin-like domain-containing protein 1 [Homalodisca vitripennis]XP_046682539.1 transmembrane and ubiquitin-like domain-containing protein 1 [Homalodisca vitripennis]XP_046682540.1 transmembrane and ubiquitin-like domain-containing protein 1 [Homalodisca vitripennis]XP_046682541.1 transmembrane and ubiquitin-like domain-containing protein 1 [Homalodisca vitripennis]
MSVIEGIGDEVVQFFSVVLVVVLAVAAWWSTSIRESHHNIRTVLILERRSRNRTGGESIQPPAAVPDTDNAIDTGQQDASDGVETEILTDDSQEKDDSESSTTCVSEGTDANPSPEATQLSPEEGSAATEPQCDSSSSEQNLRKRIGPFLKAQAATLLSEPTRNSVEEQTVREGDQIRIRLKYLNEDQKLVEGRLQEQLGEFKRRHFSIELSADKLVRLIFNGQVLGSDQQTLQACGLYDNCVVHCLVHSQRVPTRPPTAPNTPVSPVQPPDWNLSTLLYTCLSLVLCLVWYCRYQYAQLFTLTTTAALIGLTGIFTVSVFSLYLPDQDGIPH